MTKESYIKEFGYIILNNDEALLSTSIRIHYFMKIYLRQNEMPDYMWN